MRHTVIYILVLLVMGCHSYEKPEKPDDLISKEKMASILYDVYILNAAKGSSKIILENNGIYPERYVFEKHGIDSLQFAKSNAYYGFFVDDYEAIINDVEQRINVNKEFYSKLVEEEGKRKKRVKDSLDKLNDSLKIKQPTEKKPVNQADSTVSSK